MAPQSNENGNLSSATEIDQLLVPVNERKIYPNETSRNSQNRPLIVGSVVALTAVFILFTIHSEFKDHSIFEKQDRTYIPSKQINVLNALTTSKVNAANTKNKFDLVQTQKQESPTTGKPKTTVCSSQLMIMRHCEKEEKVIVGGEVQKTDTEDMFGNRHCNSKGKARSEYIATLFVDPESEKQAKINTDGASDVPMTNTFDLEASIKPQFPSPMKLYALSEARYKNEAEDHKNFREIETLLPTASKFYLTVDNRFGVRDEGDLAKDVFETLRKSVAQSVDNALTMKRTTNATEPYTVKESRDICDNGMVVVNWKHSRIPNLSAALGCGKEEGCPTKYHSLDFDTVWLLTFQYSIVVGNRSSASHFHYHLKNSPITVEGEWKVSAQLVKEGFASN
jgi:hypothetical protein